MLLLAVKPMQSAKPGTCGPCSQVAVGRRDATAPDPDGRLPELTASAEELLANFAAKGLSADELLVLSGSHTVGAGLAACQVLPGAAWLPDAAELMACARRTLLCCGRFWHLPQDCCCCCLQPMPASHVCQMPPAVA